MSVSSSSYASSVQSLVTRLAKIIKARYDAEISFSWLSDLSPESRAALVSETGSVKGSTEAPLSYVFPVFSHYRLVGQVVVKGPRGLNSSKAEDEMRDLVELFLDHNLALSDQIETLDMIQSQLESAQASVDTDNVIPIRRSKTNPELKGALRSKPKPRIGFALPTFIEGLSYADMRNLALEIHELSGRYAFLHLSDLAWTSRDELADLGPITLYVPDIGLLTFEEQRKLGEHLRSRPGVDTPQFIFGSLSTYKELRESNLVDSPLLEAVSVCRLIMDRPFIEYKKAGIAELFFSGLVRNPSRTDHLN